MTNRMMHKIAVNSIERVGKEMGVTKQAMSIQYKKIKSKVAKRLLIQSENCSNREAVEKLVNSEMFDEILFRACWEEWGSGGDG
jgi:hypothetical protein